MGHGAWDDNSFAAGRTFRAARGVDDFAYTAQLRAQTASSWRAHPSLDPFGVRMRECRDSPEHPDSLPIAVLFDVTGSMGVVPRIMQSKLGQLHGLLQRKGYVQDPQILFGGIGDADSDRVPLQVGQFESGNAMDDQLRAIFLEGNGGGQKSESYELAAYFMARHVETDAWSRRGRKGYLFIIGDELNKKVLQHKHIRQVIGDEQHRNLEVAALYRELARRWNVYFIMPGQSSYYGDPQIRNHWKDLLGEGFLELEDPAAVCELIAVTVGLREGSIDLDRGLDDLRDAGSGAQVATIRKSLVGTSLVAIGTGVTRRGQSRAGFLSSGTELDIRWGAGGSGANVDDSSDDDGVVFR